MIMKSNTNVLHLQVLLQNSPFPTGIFRVQVRHISYTTSIDSLPTKEKIKNKNKNKKTKNLKKQKQKKQCLQKTSNLQVFLHTVVVK